MTQFEETELKFGVFCHYATFRGRSGVGTVGRDNRVEPAVPADPALALVDAVRPRPRAGSHDREGQSALGDDRAARVRRLRRGRPACRQVCARVLKQLFYFVQITYLKGDHGGLTPCFVDFDLVCSSVC